MIMNHAILKLGFINISIYSICILIGVLIAGALIMKESKKNGIPEFFVSNLMFWVIIFGILGARVYYVLFNLHYYAVYPAEIIKVWRGGLAIHGGIIVGLIVFIIYCRKYNVKVLKMLDISLPAVMLAQAIGRWGNFFNGEAYGSVVSKSFLQGLHIPKYIISGMYINGNYHHPTFLYESFFCVIGAFVLIGIRSMKKTKTGNVSALYFIWYGVLRFFIESLRTDSLMLGSLKMAQVISVIMVVCGFVLYCITYKNEKNYQDDKPDSKKIRI